MREKREGVKEEDVMRKLICSKVTFESSMIKTESTSSSEVTSFET